MTRHGPAPLDGDTDDTYCRLCDVGGLHDPLVAIRSRRSVLRSVAMAGGVAVAAPALLPQVAVAATPSTGRRTLVCIFLRGGLDGLSTVWRTDDNELADARPTIHVPGGTTIDPTWTAHPALAPLLDLVGDGHAAFVHAIGNPDPIRSHFSAQAAVEAGADGENSGWLGRLVTHRGTTDPALGALAVAERLPASLAGSEALALADLAQVRIDAAGAVAWRVRKALRDLADASPGPFAAATNRAIDAVQSLKDHGVADIEPVADFPTSLLGEGLRQVAAALRAGVPLEVACLDSGGFDLHADLGEAGGGRQAELLDDLARSLAAFADDLGGLLDDVVVVAVSEFGRRLHENASAGADHGRGGLAIVLGGGVTAGVHGTWPGLAPGQLDHPRPGDPLGDLAVTTDVRDLWAEAIAATATATEDVQATTTAVLRGHTPTRIGVLAS